MLPIIGLIVGAISKVAGSWLETRKVKAEGRIRIAAAKVEAKVKYQEQLGEMDLAAQRGMMFSWKDEYLLLVLTTPVIMAFIPPLADYALAGFAVIKQMPDWYQWAMTGMIAATFGIRTWKGFIK